MGPRKIINQWKLMRNVLQLRKLGQSMFSIYYVGCCPNGLD